MLMAMMNVRNMGMRVFSLIVDMIVIMADQAGCQTERVVMVTRVVAIIVLVPMGMHGRLMRMDMGMPFQGQGKP